MDSQIRYLAIVSEQPDSFGAFLLHLFRHARARPLRCRRCCAHRRLLQYLDAQAAGRRRGAGHQPLRHHHRRYRSNRSPAQRFRAQDGYSPRRRRPVPRRLSRDRSLRPSRESFHASVPHAKVERTFPCIRHIAVCVPNNDEVLDFYVNVFGFRESTTSKKIRAENRVVRWAADGETAMAILPDRTRRDMNERESPRDGLNHFGWLVNRYRAFSGFLAGGLRQSTAEQPAHGRIPRLRSRPKPLRHLTRQRLRDRRRSLGARLSRAVQILEAVGAFILSSGRTRRH